MAEAEVPNQNVWQLRLPAQAEAARLLLDSGKWPPISNEIWRDNLFFWSYFVVLSESQPTIRSPRFVDQINRITASFYIPLTKLVAFSSVDFVWHLQSINQEKVAQLAINL